ncbi:VOC family protein [Streptomyces rishiriensis]|uniref:VOC family protein n=1 Tax=Streptomyces rishiriensis TaxID=68264 RepID=UPI0033EA1958
MPKFPPVFHHVGIQTNDLDNSMLWYQDFFGCCCSWTQTTFSELTRRRLPGIVRLVEMVVGDIRIHLFERQGRAARGHGDSAVQFQHVCMAVDSGDELLGWREKWLGLYSSGSYTFAFDDQPTEIVVDADGTRSFYALDVNGLEFEFTCPPSPVG